VKPTSVALVHDWLVSWRGGEKVLEVMANMFPQANIYTLFHDANSIGNRLSSHQIEGSILNKIPFAKQRHRFLLPLMPWAISRFKLPQVDLVISSSHCVAKSIPIPNGTKHLSYVHAPLRYMYDRFDDYFGTGKASIPVRIAAHIARPLMQKWDSKTDSVHRFVANSEHVKKQIFERYNRDANVIHPPVELDRFASGPLGTGSGKYFLCFGALAPYKRIDLAIEAFRGLDAQLYIAGSGQSSHWLKSLPPNVKALGQISDEDLPQLYSNARALIFPGVEDFGITPLEAQACGRPVIAFGQGGALETVTNKTGLFFSEQTVESIRNAVKRFDLFEETFNPSDSRVQANRFSKDAFIQALRNEIDAL
jgi:glycosyltransferase involved in cell wall biosynthesis